MNILIWHVHGSWTTAFVQGPHRYLIPDAARNGGRGAAPAWDWPPSAIEIGPQQLADEPIDLVVPQRPHEFEMAAGWLRRAPGRDVPAVYLEHNAPGGPAASSRHPAAGPGSTFTLVHVTHFNAARDAGRTRDDGGRARDRGPGLPLHRRPR